MPLRNGSLRIAAHQAKSGNAPARSNALILPRFGRRATIRKTEAQPSITQFAARPGGFIRLPGGDHEPAPDIHALPDDGRHVVPVRHLRHGRRHDSDGVLLVLLPLPEAMMLHGVTQMASNGWRGLLWGGTSAGAPVGGYVVGCADRDGWSGRSGATCRASRSRSSCSALTPFMVLAGAEETAAEPGEPAGRARCYGLLCMTLMLLTGVSGPLIDTFFLGGKIDRREIVATKAVCQIVGHAAKLVYFGGIIDQAASVDPLVAGLAITELAGRHQARDLRARSHDRPAVPRLGQWHHHGDRRMLPFVCHVSDGFAGFRDVAAARAAPLTRHGLRPIVRPNSA